MTEPPRRLPPTQEERLRVISRRMAPGSNDGQTRHARPVIPNLAGPRSIPAAGVPIGAVLYRDPGHPSFGGSWDLSDLIDSVDDTSAFTYNAGTGDIDLALGWYIANVYGNVSGMTAGDKLYIEALVGWDGGADAEWTARGGAFTEFPSVSTIPFFTAGTTVDGVAVNGQLTKVGASGTISTASVYIVKLS